MWSVFKLQYLIFVYDLRNNHLKLPYFLFVTNNAMHNHLTRKSNNIHIPRVTTLDMRNFMYNCIFQ